MESKQTCLTVHIDSPKRHSTHFSWLSLPCCYRNWSKLLHLSGERVHVASLCVPFFSNIFLGHSATFVQSLGAVEARFATTEGRSCGKVGKGGVPFDSLRLKSSLSFWKMKSQIFIQMNCLIFYFVIFSLLCQLPIGSIDAIYAVWGFRRGKPAGATLLAGNHQVFLGEKGSVEDCTTKFYKVPFSPNKILVWAVLNPGQWMYQCATEFMESSAILNQIRLNCRLPSFWIVGTLGGLAEQPFWHLQIDRLLWSSGMIPYYPLLWSHWRLHSILWFRCFKFLSFKSCFHSPALFLIKSMLWVSTEKSSWLRLL